MGKYKYLILDVDGTLLDFDKSESNAFYRTLEACKITPNSGILELFLNICDEVWMKYDLDNTKDLYIRKNYHKCYRSYALERFIYLEKEMKTGIPPEQLSTLFFQKYKEEFWPEPDAVEVCRFLSKYCCLALATNGLADIQRCRVSVFMNDVTHIFISEEVGAIKPAPVFFEHILKAFHVVDPTDCLMVGDSLSNDIAGAGEAGMDTCWYNRRRKARDSSIKPAYEISRLSDLLRLIK